MKKNALLALLSLMLFTVSSAFTQEEKRDEILQNHFEAIGQDKLNDVESMKMIGRSLVQGTEFPFTMYIKHPNLVRNEVSVQGQQMIQAYDGKNGWMIAPWMGPQARELSGIEVKSMEESAKIGGDLYKWKEKGHQLEYLGEDQVKDQPVYHLKLTRANGDTIHYYLDREKYMVLKQSTQSKVNGQQIEVDTYLSNYEMIDGMAFPMYIESRFVGQSTQVTIDSLELNVNLEEALFRKPGSNNP